jgi:hypothetical protein
MPDTCRHCLRLCNARPRGLCFTCYESREIRAMYPRHDPCGKEIDDDGHPTASMTMAELDAFIEMRRATMPGGNTEKHERARRGPALQPRSRK